MVEAGGASGDPGGGAQGADGEGVARGGPVGQFQAFAVGGEEDGVVADDVAAADGMEADFLFGAFADEAGAAVHGDVGQGPAVAGGGGFAEVQRGAGGGVFLAAVVALGDFAVVAAAAEGAGGLLDQRIQQVDADAHVGGQHDGDLFRRAGDGGFFGVAEPGGADDPREAGGGQDGGGGGAGGRETEIHGGIGAGGEGGGEVGADRHAQGREARGGTDVLSGERGIGAVHGGHDPEAGDGPGSGQAGDGQAHAACGADQQEFHGGAHDSRSSCWRVSRRSSRLAPVISHRGRRYTAGPRPAISMAALTGMGLVSRKSRVNSR